MPLSMTILLVRMGNTLKDSNALFLHHGGEGR